MAIRRPRILFVDWDPHSRTIYGAMLRHRGFDVIVAEQCDLPGDREWPTLDLVLIDPAACEAAALQRVRRAAELHGLPTLALTFHAMAQELDAMRNEGFDEVLLRPMSPQDVVDAVQRAIAGRQPRAASVPG